MSRKRSAQPAAVVFTPPPWLLAALAFWTVFNVAYIPRHAGVPRLESLAKWLNAPLVGVPQFSALLSQSKRLTLAAAFWFVLTAAGRRLLRALSVAAHNLCEELALSAALGYGAWGTVLLLLGLTGLWQRGLLLGLSATGLGWALYDWRRSASGQGAGLALPTAADRFFLGALACGWCYVARYALIPETFYDALQYHLSLPSQYLLNARIGAVPENSYSGMPALPQMLYALALAFDRWGITASVLHSTTLLWIALALVGLATRLGRPGAGWLAAAAFFFAPVVTAECYRVSVGLEWTLFELCCFTALLAALGKDFPERRGWLLLCGCFLGFAMSSKYQAWLLPLALLPAAGSKRLSLRELIFVFCAAGVCLAPWVVKNLWLYRNPIYPFFQDLFSPHSVFMPDWRQMSSAGAGASSSLLGLHGLLHYAGHPWRFLASTEDLSLSIGPFALCFLPLLFLSGASDEERLLAKIALCCWLPLSLVSELTRYFIPHLALITVLIACAAERVAPAVSRKAVLAASFLLLTATGLGWAVLDGNRAKLAVFHGDKGYDEYLAHVAISYPTPAYAGIEHLNKASPPGTRVLVFGDPRAFYLRRPYLAASSDQPDVLEVWANESADGAALRRRLQSEGIGYILLNLGEKARTHKVPRLTPAGFKALDDFWLHDVLIEYGAQDPGDRWVAVYRVLKDSEPAQNNTEDKFIEVLKWLKQKGASQS